MTKDEEHLRLLVIFYYALGALQMLCSCTPIFHLAMGIVMLVAPESMGPPEQGPPRAVGALFAVIGGLAMIIGLLISVATIYAGRCLARRQKYAYCFVMAAVLCAMAPLGTALGVFTIVVLMRDSVKTLFGVPVASTSTPVLPPPA